MSALDTNLKNEIIISESDDDHSIDYQGQGEEETWEDWEEDERDRVKSLFSDATFSSVDEALAHDAKEHNFDLNKYRIAIGASDYDTLKIINYIRYQVSSGIDPLPTLSNTAPITKQDAPWHDILFLTPIIDNDELLFHDWEDYSINDSGANKDQNPSNAEDISGIIEEMQAMALKDDALRDLLINNAGGSNTKTPQQQHFPETQQDNQVNNNDQIDIHSQQQQQHAAIDASYFESYSFFDIHRDMLSDKVRTESYQKALEQNPELIKGATLLDVGCGTGVLSMFAARGGASKVIGVDGSKEMAKIAREICEKNGFREDTINIISSKIENLEELPSCVEKVDVLVSEWMGYALLFESMLDSVLIARDRFLKPGGAILPDKASIYIAGASQGASGLDFWDNVYGFDMTPISKKLQNSSRKEAMVRLVDPQHLLTEEKCLISLDLATMSAKDQDFSSEFSLKPGSGPFWCHYLVIWFDVSFSERFCASSPQDLPTGPYSLPTHWAQTVLQLPVPLEMAPAALRLERCAIEMKGRLSMARRVGRHRTLDISLEYTPIWIDGQSGETEVQLYTMGVIA